MPKSRAVALHFLISLTIVSGLLAVIFLIWYPAPFFRISGAQNALRTLIGVDLVLGPVLTAYLYRPGKRGLIIDMWFIAIVQLSALAYGSYVLYIERPQYMVFAVDRFVVMTDRDVTDPQLARGHCQGHWRLPCVMVAEMPTDAEIREALLFRSVEQGIELEQQPEFWRPLDEAMQGVLDRARPLQAIIDHDQNAAESVNKMLLRHDRALDSVVYVPVVNKMPKSFALVVDARTAATVAMVSVDPWDVN
ncbi:MAG: hypothetical protein AAF270_11035 [Pseudomonadota bacterium]